MDLFKLHIDDVATVFAAIWQRTPVILALKNEVNNDSILDTLFNFIPEYRQPIICGQISKKVFFEQKNAKKLSTDDLDSLIETLHACYTEDGILSLPIQTIYLNAKKQDFQRALLNLKHGWIAVTYLPMSDIAAIFKTTDLSPVLLQDNAMALFPMGKPVDNLLEKSVLQQCENTNSTVKRFILQMKISEVRFLSKALLDDIEKGNKINQVEVEDLFGINEAIFKRTLGILKNEFHVDPTPYIHFTTKSVSDFLKQILKINGVIAAVAGKDDNLLAIEKKKQVLPVSTEIMAPFMNLLKKSKKQEFWGDDLSLVIKSQDNSKLLFCYKYFPPEKEYIGFAFFLDAELKISLMMSEIEKLLEKLA